MDKEIIRKTFENIIKSHQHLTLQHTNVKAPMDKFAHSTRKRKREKAIILNDKGEEVFSKNGGESSVDIGGESKLKDLYEEYGALHLDHNHPSGELWFSESLSDADCFALKSKVRYYDDHEGWGEWIYPLKSITCEGTNGSRMTLVRGDKFSAKNEEKFTETVQKYIDYVDKYEENFYRLREEKYSELVDKVRNGELSYDGSIHDLASNETLKEIGNLEDSNEFKSIQRDFRNCNCKLKVEWIDI